MERYMELKGKYPHFVYQDYDYTVRDHKLEGRCTYVLQDESGESAFEFFTLFAIEFIGGEVSADADLDALVFNLGLVEAISYWKLTCAPQFTIKCGGLSDEQKDWWRKLFQKGLSEFFYLNNITDWEGSQLQFTTTAEHKTAPAPRKYTEEKVLVPIGGGKDSISSVEILKGNIEIVPVVMNPIKASTDFMAYEGLDKYVKITRKLDPLIIKLNADGFLNGHIPFSAVLSFYTMIAARMYGMKYIALSNESSANEPTILGTDINHQYSKSLEYELDINAYATDYLDADIRYFSLLRPFNEYQITKIFAGVNNTVLDIFRSCNKGSKKGIWCIKCPKCLFTYIMIHAHLPLSKMIEIYGNDLLEDKDLEGYFLSLTGQRTEKPFECVGTVEEVNAALQVIKQKRKNSLPHLFTLWDSSLVERNAEELLKEVSPSNHEPFFAELIKQKTKDLIN